MNLPNMLEAKKRSNKKIEEKNYELDEKYKTLGKDKLYYIKTYGCQMNEHDSEVISALLESVGYTKTEEMEDAHLILLNTCAIRENAHDKAIGMMGRVKHLKDTKKDVKLVICGCMSQEENIVDLILKKYKYVDIVLGTHNIDRILEYLYNLEVKKEKRQIEVYSCEGNIIEDLPSKRDNKYKAWVNIMLGCDKFCTYCIVPYTRGRQRSRKKENIIKEIKELKRDGVKEITLLGQNVNAYGKDIYSDYDMGDLLQDVSKINIERIRFVTSHPWDFTDNMIKAIKENDNIMPYVHLPIQSGSNKILKLMGRKYTKEEYIKLFNKLKEEIPNIAISTDIIVGFPGETDEDYNETLDVVNTCKFDSAFTFIFSPRENTPAAKMKNTVDDVTKDKRLFNLNLLVNDYSLEKNKELLYKTIKVFIEGKSTRGKFMYKGYTDTMKLVNVYSTKNIIGKTVNVYIYEAKSFSLDGELTK